MDPEIQSLVESIRSSLTLVETSAGIDAAACTAECLMRLAIFHVFDNVGPQAAKSMLVRIYSDLEQEIAGGNGGSTAFS